MQAVENRGKQASPAKIPSETWKLVKEHWESLPHKKSHYGAQKTEKKFFVNCDLTIKEIYDLFMKFYKVRTKKTCKLHYKTYHKYFRENSEYSIRQLRTDVCDFCAECKVKLKINPNDPCAELYRRHKADSEQHLTIRTEFVTKIAKEESKNTIVLEFDYAQNLALPKLNNNSQYYKRQLNLYVFNVHCFNDESSEFYCFLESEGKKNANSVCSFLHNSICKQLEEKPDTKTVVCLSDSCGGQNKNQVVIRFCSWASVFFKITIVHYFPVRGHSYCQCDRNFGCYGSILKRKEIIETPNEYLEVMRSARVNPSPFKAEMSASLLENWDSGLQSLFLKKPIAQGSTFSIQKYVKLEYKPTKEVIAYTKYNCSGEIFTYFKDNAIICSKEDLNIEKLPVIGIKSAKKKDLKFLLRFLKQSSKFFYNNLFKVYENIDNVVDNNQTSSESDNEEED